MLYDIESMKGRVHESASDMHNLYSYTMQDMRNNSIEMNHDIKAIAEALQNGGDVPAVQETVMMALVLITHKCQALHKTHCM